MHFGVDYYPEHWPRERWDVDARLMQEAHMNVVRLAEFAWSKLEPREGEYCFDWLDEAIEVLANAGLKVVMCTPTASPPVWLIEKESSVLPVNEHGMRLGFGGRRHACLNNSVYRSNTERIVREVARHYGSNDAVIGWQIDNEFGCHNTARCYCSTCRNHFHDWLKEKYGDIDNLNEKWGTIFWSQTYSDWAQIPTPIRNVCGHNPSLILDYYRFCSDSNVSYQKLQCDVLRSEIRDQFITHNFMGLFGDLDYYDLAKDLDLVSWDNYPMVLWGKYDLANVALAHDLMRSVKQKNFWVMEQQSGPTGLDALSGVPLPGQLRLWAYQAIGHGADGIVFFRWRACRFGSEQNWHGVLDHHGNPGRRYEEIKRMGKELSKIGGEIKGSVPIGQAAILNCYETRWSTGIQPTADGYSYEWALELYYRSLFENSIQADIIEPTSDLGGYSLVIAPALHMIDESIAKNLSDYVKNGGTLILGMRAGVRDFDNVILDEVFPGKLQDLVGARLKEYDSLTHGEKVSIKVVDDSLASEGVEGSLWSDILSVDSATVLAEYADKYYKGSPAITLNQYGSGQVIYVGTHPPVEFLTELIARVYTGRRCPVEKNLHIEVVEREKDGQRYFFVLNDSMEKQVVRLQERFQDLLSGEEISGMMEVEANDVRILELCE